MKHYRIADLHVVMNSFGRTEAQAAPYEIHTDGEPDIVISSSGEKYHQVNPGVSLDVCEYMCTGSSFYTQFLILQK